MRKCMQKIKLMQLFQQVDFQHALHTVEAANAKKDVYVENFAETMADARIGLKAANDGIVLQVDPKEEVESIKVEKQNLEHLAML